MTPAEIAAGLTKAQREALMREYVCTSNGAELRWQHEVGSACRCALQRIGVYRDSMFSTELTPLGLAIRAILMEQDNG